MKSSTQEKPLPSSLGGDSSYQNPQPKGGPFLDHYPGDSYASLHQTGEGVRRLREGWERYRREESERETA